MLSGDLRMILADNPETTNVCTLNSKGMFDLPFMIISAEFCIIHILIAVLCCVLDHPAG